MDILDMDILYLSSLENWTIEMKEVQLIPAVHICLMEEDHSSMKTGIL